jgi:hypothetical protein
MIIIWPSCDNLAFLFMNYIEVVLWSSYHYLMILWSSYNHFVIILELFYDHLEHYLKINLWWCLLEVTQLQKVHSELLHQPYKGVIVISSPKFLWISSQVLNFKLDIMSRPYQNVQKRHRQFVCNPRILSKNFKIFVFCYIFIVVV